MIGSRWVFDGVRVIGVVAAVATSGCASAEGGDEPSESGVQSEEAEVRAFELALSEAFLSSDFGWLIDHLHPAHFEHWTADQCVAAMTAFDPEVAAGAGLTRGDVDNVGEYALIYPGVDTFEFGNAFRVPLLDETGEELRRVTVSLDDGGPYWFANCTASGS